MEMDPIEKQKLDKEKKEFIANLKRKHAIQQISDIMVSLCNVLSLYTYFSVSWIISSTSTDTRVQYLNY
jgi:hypothetical protein